jgi:hypothetical protein
VNTKQREVGKGKVRREEEGKGKVRREEEGKGKVEATDKRKRRTTEVGKRKMSQGKSETREGSPLERGKLQHRQVILHLDLSV